MAKPLFADAELKKHAADLQAHEKKRQTDTLEWKTYWSEREALVKSFQLEMATRAQGRAEEFLNALTVLVGTRGRKFVDFDHAFLSSDTEGVKVMVAVNDTPATRRALYTILRALTEIPKNWATSAFVRHLRGIGKQRGSKYHGAGTLGADYGWTEREVSGICGILTQADQRYCQVLMSYADVAKEIEETDPDYEIVDQVTAEYIATRAERDVEFLHRLCEMLEARGLAPVPEPAAKRPTKPRKVKQFKSGDLIRSRTLRDLPLPAHVRVVIEKQHDGSNQWLGATMDLVVAALQNGGSYDAFVVDTKGTRAYRPNLGWDLESKEWLDGATYLGPWTGELDTKKTIKINFRYRRPEE